MRTIEKKCLTRTQKLAIILSSVLVFLIIASVVLSIVYANIPTDEEEGKLPEIDEALGEALYHTSPLAYPLIDTANISAVIVRNDKGTFDLTRFPDENGAFYLGYKSPSGDESSISYLPPIMAEEANFNYETLYAMEEDDGYGTIFMLSYLMQALGTPYFHERIYLPADAAARAEMLASFGLDDENKTSVSFAYGERDDEGVFTAKGNRHIDIGDSALNGYGRYYRVDGRDCIYYSGHDTLKYAELGFESFVRGVLVAEGLDEDKTFEPLLTTDFKEWKNEIIESGRVTDKHSVIAKGDVFSPIKESAAYTPEKYPDGYLKIENGDLTFDLSGFKGADRDRLIAALVGKEIGAQAEPIYITLISDYVASANTVIDFGDAESVKYKYVINKIEAILDYEGGNECRTDGTPVGEGKLLLVGYDYYIGGEKQNTSIERHAVINLDDALLSGYKSAFASASVGELAAPISIDIEYTKANAARTVRKLYVKDIIKIYDSDGKIDTRVTSDGYATITYYETVNGVMGEVRSMDVPMATIKEKAGFEAIYDAILGKEQGIDLAILASETVSYSELFREFVTSRVQSIERCLESELVVSFNFKNASERDPFYGESIYENTTEQYKLYGIHSDNCQQVLRLLGGIGDNSTKSDGLHGKTVAVGLTHDVKHKYGLNAYTIYFELPRGIYDIAVPSENEDEESKLDYGSYDTVGFTLYISEVVYITDEKTREVGKYRYVGSDMYDLVALVDNSKLEFVDYSFVDFWARRTVVLLDLDTVASFGVDFYMNDVYGSYDFEIKKDIVYKQGQTMSLIPFEGYETTIDWYNVYVKQADGSMQNTELAKYIAANGTNDKGQIGVHTLYNAVMGGGKDLTLPDSIEWVGVSNFFLAYQVLSMTSYEGTLTEAEQALATDENKVMSIRLQLSADNASELPYVYDFHRISDRKVMVRFYQVDSTGNPEGEPVSDFYISTFAFKKLASAYLSVLNAEQVDVEVPYPDEVG